MKTKTPRTDRLINERKAHTALRSTGIVSQRDWKIWLKHARLWKGWKHLVTVYGFDRETAEQKAKECLYYYEGTTKWKVTLANDEASNGRRLVSRRRERQALEALVALALRNVQGIVTDEEIENYMSQPVNLTKEDEAALKRARPKLLAALRKELRPDAKRLQKRWGKPANAEAIHSRPTASVADTKNV